MKLISMTDFVILQNLLLANKEITQNECGLRILKYANFLKQPLTLGMFVPCDDEGNILEYPIDGMKIGKHSSSYDVYNKAEKKVLFEGFEIMPDSALDFTVVNYRTGISKYLGQAYKNHTIESLVIKGEIKITKNGLKQI